MLNIDLRTSILHLRNFREQLCHWESMHCYLLLVPRKEVFGVTQHNTITPRAQIFQRAECLQEIRIFPHQRKLTMPLNRIQSQRDTRKHVFSHYVHVVVNPMVNFTQQCLSWFVWVSYKDRLRPGSFGNLYVKGHLDVWVKIKST